MPTEAGGKTPQPRLVTLKREDGGTAALLTGRPETAGMRSGLVVLPAGASVGTHNTGSREELIVVLEGRGEFRCEGAAPVAIGPETAVYCPPRREHDVVNTGPGPLRYVYVAAEAR